jgi:dCMP deaminase
MSRPGWIEWALGIADAVAKRADCTRRQVGAVILDRNHWPVAVGYNGSYPGGPSCLKGECPRGRHYVIETACADRPEGVMCRCGASAQCPMIVPAGSSYDTGPGACVSVHAELNARLHVTDLSRIEGGTLIVTAEPCDGCLKIYRSTPIREICWRDDTGIIWSRTHPFEKE